MTQQSHTIQNLILDMDGVLWRGDAPMPGLQAFFRRLHDLDVRYTLATNNATKTAAQYTEKLRGFGVDVPREKILTSAEATAELLTSIFERTARAYVVGDAGLQQAIRAAGFEVVAADGFIEPATRVDFVVVGFTQYACYPQLASAAYLINNGARFFGTNPDPTFPTEVGPLPGAGSYLNFLRTATGVAPEVVGKPEPAIFRAALHHLQSSPETTAMVGDRLETDIAGAQALGIRTVLLLSGVTKIEDLEGSDVQPDMIFDSISELGDFLAQATERIEP
jgi:4-nitrophenyl phosphatase